jgi:cysteinyl-tRNA synthetase
MPKNLHLQNTLTGKKQIFHPRHPDKKVRMFTCGPSIYDRPHLGNYRTFLFEDILQRYLQYLGFPVKRLINFTDMEDKAIARANKLGVSIDELTRPMAEQFIKDCSALSIALPETIARSTTCVDSAVLLIQRLLEKKIAYKHGPDIFYDPLKFKGFGRLFGLDMSKWPEKKIRFRKDTYPGQRWNLGDFILWKGWRKKDGPFFWQTSLGKGRPAWNVQDPAMIVRHLGYELDICCGGIDNIYRHHDYNIAVVEGVSGKVLAPFWLHGGHVRVKGIKMAKSKGNIVYPDDLFFLGYEPRHVRFFLICSHYRKSLNLTAQGLDLARGRVDTFRTMARRIEEKTGSAASSDPEARALAESLQKDFETSMNNDLDVETAFEKLYNTLQSLVRISAAARLSGKDAEVVISGLKKIDQVLKILY